MTIINVEKIIFTPTRKFNVIAECLTDDLKPITTGKIICIMNKNILIDIKEVRNSKVNFEINIPEYLEQGNEYLLRFSYSGSEQSEAKTVTSIILFNKKYEQIIQAEIIVDDYYAKRGDTVHFTSYIKTENDIPVSGKAVLKMDEQTIGNTRINDNKADFEFTIPGMILNEHTLLWKYGTNKGIFVTTSLLQLEPKITVDKIEYYPDNGTSDEIRKILKQTPASKEKGNTKTSFKDKLRKIF